MATVTTTKVNCSLSNAIIQGFCFFLFLFPTKTWKTYFVSPWIQKNWIVWNKIFIIDSSSYLRKWIMLRRLNIFMHVHVYIMNMKSSNMYIWTLFETISKVQISLEVWPDQCLHLAPTVQAKIELLKELHCDNGMLQDLTSEQSRLRLSKLCWKDSSFCSTLVPKQLTLEILQRP